MRCRWWGPAGPCLCSMASGNAKRAGIRLQWYRHLSARTPPLSFKCSPPTRHMQSRDSQPALPHATQTHAHLDNNAHVHDPDPKKMDSRTTGTAWREASPCITAPPASVKSVGERCDFGRHRLFLQSCTTPLGSHGRACDDVKVVMSTLLP
jgi:hypothetical protein